MYLGKVIELVDHLAIFENPQHPYTQALLSAIPIPRLDIVHKGRIILEGDVPSPVNPPAGCRFHGRCPSRQDDCLEKMPELEEVTPNHFLACSGSVLPFPTGRRAETWQGVTCGMARQFRPPFPCRDSLV
jgi:peptide/nickel transport system ATP-binding protein